MFFWACVPCTAYDSLLDRIIIVKIENYLHFSAVFEGNQIARDFLSPTGGALTCL